MVAQSFISRRQRAGTGHAPGRSAGDVLLVVLQQREKASSVPIQVPHQGVPLVVATLVAVDVGRDCKMRPPHASDRASVAVRSALRPSEGVS